MLQFHDLAKADMDYQHRRELQTTLELAAGSTWIVYTDCVVHAATSGQYALEQTFYLDPEAMLDVSRSPLRVLERLTKKNLLPSARGFVRKDPKNPSFEPRGELEGSANVTAEAPR